MKNKKILRMGALLLSAMLSVGSVNAFADETVTETESYADEITPIEFGITGFVITTNANTAVLKWSLTSETNEYITSHSVDVEIYRSVGVDTNYTKIASVNSSCLKQMSYVDTSLLAGNNYYYKLRISGYYDEAGTRIYHELDGDFVSYAYNPVKLINKSTQLSVDISTISNHRIKLNWYQIYPKGYSVTSYQIYRSLSQDSGYKLISTVKNVEGKSEYEYIDEKTVLGTRYYYKIRAVLKKGGVTSYSDYSNVVTRVATIDQATITSIKSTAPRTLTLTWQAVDGADGYYIYYKQGKTGEYSLVGKLVGNSVLTYTKKELTNGKKYYFRVCAYKVFGNTEYTSIAAKSKYCDYYGYKNESYKSKYKRVFKKTRYVYYKSDIQARKHMKTIKIKVWDKTASRWYPRTFSIMVNRGIAPTVKAIFRSLYKLDESKRRPIHDIGGYSWRGKGSTSEHNQGLAIDINPNENYMIRNGVVQSGSFWKPKKNLYSIPSKGKFVNTLKRYGFDRCIWNYSATEYVRDYMHFSYNGGR